MKKILIFIIPIVLFTYSGCNTQDVDNPQENDYEVKVSTIPVRQDTIKKTLTLSGRLKGARDIMILPQMTARIDEIRVEVGQKVKKGQTLVKMERDRLEQAESKFKTAKKNYKRLKKLRKDSLVSIKSYEKAKTAYKSAKSAYQIAKKNTELAAPFSGTVVEKYFNENQIYAPNRRGIVRLATTDKLQMEVQIASKDYHLLKNGQKAEVHTRFNRKPVTGRVTDLSTAADAGTGLFSAKVVINNPPDNFRIGVFAEAKVILKEHTQNIVIPPLALVRDSIVYAVKGNTLKRRVVETGIVKSNLIEITNGLQVGESIVKEGTVGLKDGMEIRISGREN